MTENKTYREGTQAAVPIMLGYLGIGFATGIIGITAGLSILEIAIMSLLMYAGSSQMMLISLIAMGAPLPVMISTVFIMNIRYLLLSMNVAPHFRQYSYLQNIFIGALLTDETFSLVNLKYSKNETVSLAWMNGLNIAAYIAWGLATTLGAILGKLIPNPAVFGLDFALTAMFIALLTLQIEALPKKMYRKISIVITAVAGMMYIGLQIMDPNMAVLLSAMIGATIGVWLDR